MALFYQQNINPSTKLAIWEINEPESFFMHKVALQREITHPHKRLQHLAGHYLLKYLFPDFPNEEILIADTRKPYLPYEQYHFSISHCGNYAAAIVSNKQRVGLDIEIPSAKVLKIAHKFLSEEERNKFQVTSNKSTSSDVNKLRTSYFVLPTLLWSAKEAMFKWWGWGEVDFSEMLKLDFFTMQETGTINANFVHPKINQSLQMQYQLFANLCLCWVASEV